MNRWLAKYLDSSKGALPKPTKPANGILASGNVSFVSGPPELFEKDYSKLEQQEKILEMPNTPTDETDITGFVSNVSPPFGYTEKNSGLVSEVFDGTCTTERALVTSRSTSPSGWQPITENQGQKLLAKYSDDLELWNRFWQFLAEQSDQGAPYEYVSISYQNLELVWQRKSSDLTLMQTEYVERKDFELAKKMFAGPGMRILVSTLQTEEN